MRIFVGALRVFTCLLKGAGTRLEDFDPAAVEW